MLRGVVVAGLAVGLSLVVAGLGGSRSEKRAVGLSLVVAGLTHRWWWLASRRGSLCWWFQVVAAEKRKKKIFGEFQVVAAEKGKKKIGEFQPKPNPPSHHHHAGLASPINHHTKESTERRESTK
jgi:hypothetical protein